MTFFDLYLTFGKNKLECSFLLNEKQRSFLSLLGILLVNEHSAEIE